MTPLTRRRLISTAIAGAIAHRVTSAVANPVLPPLKELAADKGILFGSSVHASQIVPGDPFTTLLLAECACVVPEWEMKWGETAELGPDEDFTAPDKIVNFAAEHGLAVRGHNLLWYADTPDWFTVLKDRNAAEAAMVRHIRTICSHYHQRVFCWDVANEPINLPDGRPDGLRRAVFVDQIGPEYIDIAHRAARAADPNARLVVNDYGVEYDTPDDNNKRTAVLRLLERMRKAGTPVDALGIEAHLRIGHYPFSQAKLRRFLADVASLGLEIHITELDANDRQVAGSNFVRDQRVADEYARFLDVALDEPAVKVVVTWGLSDRDSYKNRDEFKQDYARSDGKPLRPLPFDAALARKPAWYALAHAFQNAAARPSPWSRP